MAGKKKKGLAHKAVLQIKKLYAIEKKAKEDGLSYDEIYQLRQRESKPLLLEFKQWCETNLTTVPPKSPIGKAIAYTLNQWDKLIVYIEDGRLEIDNNRTERAIKPFVIGRKNWLFNGSPRGAEAAANIYSLIETCKWHNIEPYAYLRYLLKHLPLAEGVDDMVALLPYNCDPAKVTQGFDQDRVILSEFIKNMS